MGVVEAGSLGRGKTDKESNLATVTVYTGINGCASKPTQLVDLVSPFVIWPFGFRFFDILVLLLVRTEGRSLNPDPSDAQSSMCNTSVEAGGTSKTHGYNVSDHGNEHNCKAGGCETP